MVFKYINMPKLVAFYLRENSYRTDETPSYLYKFVFCLCLPFISDTFRKARLNALAIAECTNSAMQIQRLLGKLTGATVGIEDANDQFDISYDETVPANISYDSTTNVSLTYLPTYNSGTIFIISGYSSKSEIEAYLELLVPFYIEYRVVYL